MMWKWWRQYQEIILYGIFGVLTTVVNIIVYWFFARFIGVNYLLSTAIAWILSVLFAFITNRLYVFESKNQNIWKEMYLFFTFRLLSGLIDFIDMYLFVDVLHFDDMVIKIVSNVIVIVLNYVFSKLFIFKGKGKENE